MPADSERPSGQVALPHTWRPFGVRMAAVVFGTALVVVCVFAWISFGEVTRAKFTPFQRGTLVFFGLLFASCGHALARSRVVAEAHRLVVVNGYRKHVYEWPEVLAVSLPPGAPWAVLDLADGTSASAMGIQGSDGARARTAVRELRTLLQG
jgi:hypothetical protein